MGLNPVHLHLIPRCGITTVLLNSAEEKQPHQANIREPNFLVFVRGKRKDKKLNPFGNANSLLKSRSDLWAAIINRVQWDNRPIVLNVTPSEREPCELSQRNCMTVPKRITHLGLTHAYILIDFIA